MGLSPGTRLGPYEIVGALGAGGMGEVYRARDTRLDRSVALKVLAPEIAGDPAARSRFEREARAVAALDHPHICGIYDVGEADGTHFLVMPLLDGQTLASRLEKGPLSLDQALTVATQVADALDKAHREGIVHRDLKPANVMLTKAGAKLLDFGLAKLHTHRGPISMSTMGAGATTSPGTTQGTILGTLHYMAPEQVEGKEADARSDIWALGAVLYEMVTGTRPFPGDTPASVIGAILKDTPASMSMRQPLATSALDHVVARCLEKDSDARWQHAGDVQRELQWVQASGAHASPSNDAGSRRRNYVALAAAAVALLVAAAIAPGWFSHRREAAPDVLQLSILPPRGTEFYGPPASVVAPQIAISPDGRELAFVAQPARGRPSLWLRSLRESEARMLPGTEGATYPFWSPDSRSLGFFAQGKLWIVEAAGGPPRALTEAALDARGGAWGADGTIVFSRLEREPLYRISSTGGTPAPATELDGSREETSHRFPAFLPDGRHFIYLARNSNQDRWGISIAALGTLAGRPLVERTSWGARYAPPGHILFLRNGTLMAQPFDLDTLSMNGEPVEVARGVGSTTTGYPAISASPSGVVIHATPIGAPGQLRWFDRTGRIVNDVGTASEIIDFELSPDERTLAFTRVDDPNLASADVWLLDLERQVPTRVTTDPQNDAAPLWSSDGDRIFFRSSRRGRAEIYTKRAVGTEPERPILDASSSMSPTHSSADGKWLVYSAAKDTHGFSLWAWPVDGSAEPSQVVRTELNATHGRLSPDSKWLAYASDESSEWQVYVQSFPPRADDKRQQVSSDGGSEPRWRRDGKELFYLSPDDKIMSVPVTTEGGFKPGTARELFDVVVPMFGNVYRTNYTVSADGQRFLVNTRVESTPPPISVIVNWPSLLRGQR
jgi:serine/threonine protein kinase/Tol biopolymer transport system component